MEFTFNLKKPVAKEVVQKIIHKHKIELDQVMLDQVHLQQRQFKKIESIKFDVDMMTAEDLNVLYIDLNNKESVLKQQMKTYGYLVRNMSLLSDDDTVSIPNSALQLLEGFE